MKRIEIIDRISGMTRETYDEVRRMMRDGYGGHGITLESDATTKQVNACFALDKLERDGEKVPLVFDLHEDRKPPMRMTRRVPKFRKRVAPQLPAAFTVFPKPHLRDSDDGSFLLPKPMAHTRVGVVEKATAMACVRIYKESPERIAFQIRTTGRVGTSRTAQCRNAFSHVSLDAGDIAAVIAELQRLLPKVAK